MWCAVRQNPETNSDNCLCRQSLQHLLFDPISAVALLSSSKKSSCRANSRCCATFVSSCATHRQCGVCPNVAMCVQAECPNPSFSTLPDAKAGGTVRQGHRGSHTRSSCELKPNWRRSVRLAAVGASCCGALRHAPRSPLKGAVRFQRHFSNRSRRTLPPRPPAKEQPFVALGPQAAEAGVRVRMALRPQATLQGDSQQRPYPARTGATSNAAAPSAKERGTGLEEQAPTFLCREG